MGRPAKQKTDLRDKTLRIRLNPSERERIDRAASKVGLLTAGWARMVLLKAAQEELGEPVETPKTSG